MPVAEYDNTTAAQDRLFRYLANQISVVSKQGPYFLRIETEANILPAITEVLRPILSRMIMADNPRSKGSGEESKEGTLSDSASDNSTVRISPIQRQLQRLGIDKPEAAASEWSERCEAF
jgi:hypothetical protein